jgi:hypothetical protein
LAFQFQIAPRNHTVLQSGGAGSRYGHIVAIVEEAKSRKAITDVRIEILMP